MEEKEYSNIYAIPANYTDSGKILGGMLEPRNAVETIVLLLAMGYPELAVIPMPGMVRIVVMTVTMLPVAVLCIMGIDGDSLFQYTGHIIRYWMNRRRLHYRRVGERYAKERPVKAKKAERDKRAGKKGKKG